MSKFFFVVVALSLILTGCSSDDSTENEEVKAQSIIQATPLPIPTPTPQPTATNLPIEIIEPISPISPVSPITVTETTLMSNDSVELIPGSEAAVTASINDLSAQMDIPVDQIKVASVEPMEWNDASLGCPQEGFMYAQVITPGYLVTLEANGPEYVYHTDQTNNVILCEQ